MDARERAERTVREYVQKSLKVGRVPFSRIVFDGEPRRYIELERFDVRALKAVQLEMLKQLFRRYEVPYSASEGKAMISVLTGGNLERYVKALVMALPIVGQIFWDDSETILAGASTYALAQIAVLRLEFERHFFSLNVWAVKQVYNEEFEEGKESGFYGQTGDGDRVCRIRLMTGRAGAIYHEEPESMGLSRLVHFRPKVFHVS